MNMCDRCPTPTPTDTIFNKMPLCHHHIESVKRYRDEHLAERQKNAPPARLQGRKKVAAEQGPGKTKKKAA